MKKIISPEFALEKLLEEMAEHLKTLGHPQRLRILNFLRENGESCVGEIVRKTRFQQAIVSFHLNKMRRCGLVISRRDAREVYYWIATEIAQVVTETLHRKLDRALGLDPLS